jgi:signal peptidase
MQRDVPATSDVATDGFCDTTIPVHPPVEGPIATRRGAWRILKGVVSTVAGFILAVIALLAIVVAIGTHFSSNGQLGLLGHPVMSVLSGSMAPVIRTGDLVVDNKLTATQAANLRVGQIMSFRAAPGSPQIFTHRIVGVVPLPNGAVGYVTKGDANDSRDGPVTPSTNVVGLFKSKIPSGGYILNALHRPLVLGLIIASPILWLLSEPLWRWAREADEPAASTTEGGESFS